MFSVYIFQFLPKLHLQVYQLRKQLELHLGLNFPSTVLAGKQLHQMLSYFLLLALDLPKTNAIVLLESASYNII